MFVPGSKSDLATLTLVLRNSQQGKVDNVVVSCPTSIFSVSSCDSMSYQNSAITLPAPLPIDGTAVGTATVTSMTGVPFVAGTTYVVTLTVSYISGSVITIAVNVVASS